MSRNRVTGRTAHSLVVLAIALALTIPIAVPGTGAAPAGPTPPSAGTVVTSGQSADACDPVSSGQERPDPTEDTLGWEDGCWHDATIRIDQRDGLNATELDAFLARAMARVEVVRRLEFEESVGVEILSREEFTERVDTELSASEAVRLRKNVKWEALMIVGEDEDAVAVQRANVGTARGYYSPTRDRIVLVSGDGTTPKVAELTLAHELVHPLQVQHFDAAERFDLSTFDQRHTTESLNAINSLLEGDAELVRRWYGERCNAEWDCVAPPPQVGGTTGGNAGMRFVTSYAYYDGPKFVNTLYRDEGWETVNAAYEDPPSSTEQVIYPDAYPVDEPMAVEFTDTSADRWDVPVVDTGQPEYVSVGQAGITGMLFYTLLDSRFGRTPVIPSRAIFNSTGGELDTFDPIVFENDPYASGWEGDRLYPYVTDASATTGETGFVWKLAFESENDSAEFVDGYTKLLRYNDATAVDGRANTFRVPEEDGSGDAYYLERSGSAVYVVNAPSVGELSEIRAGAAPRVGGPLAGLPFADEPPWVLGTILALLGAVVVLAVRLLFALRDGLTENSEAG